MEDIAESWVGVPPSDWAAGGGAAGAAATAAAPRAPSSALALLVQRTNSPAIEIAGLQAHQCPPTRLARSSRAAMTSCSAPSQEATTPEWRVGASENTDDCRGRDLRGGGVAVAQQA